MQLYSPGKICYRADKCIIISENLLHICFIVIKHYFYSPTLANKEKIVNLFYLCKVPLYKLVLVNN